MADSKAVGTFTREHPATGKKQERIAYTPAEAVNLRADGWAESKTSKTGSGGASGGSRSSSAGTTSSGTTQ